MEHSRNGSIRRHDQQQQQQQQNQVTRSQSMTKPNNIDNHHDESVSSSSSHHHNRSSSTSGNIIIIILCNEKNIGYTMTTTTKKNCFPISLYFSFHISNSIASIFSKKTKNFFFSFPLPPKMMMKY